MSLELLTHELRAIFEDTEVSVVPHLPDSLDPPMVFVYPNTDWARPEGFYSQSEMWDIVAVVNAQEPSMWVENLRNLRNKIRLACGRAGVLWQRSSGPLEPELVRDNFLVLSVATVSFPVDD